MCLDPLRSLTGTQFEMLSQSNTRHTRCNKLHDGCGWVAYMHMYANFQKKILIYHNNMRILKGLVEVE